jgi:hypothetical protein
MLETGPFADGEEYELKVAEKIDPARATVVVAIANEPVGSNSSAMPFEAKKAAISALPGEDRPNRSASSVTGRY